MKKLFTIIGALSVSASVASAAPVDLTGWTADVTAGGIQNWDIQPGNNSVLQTLNGGGTTFYDPGSSSLGFVLTGEVTGDSTDNDVIGFVLGYNSNEITSSSADFWLIDWRQQSATTGGGAPLFGGLALSHVSGDTSGGDFQHFNQHISSVNEVQRGSTLSSTGWTDGTTYNFQMTFLPDLIEVKIDGVTELLYTSADNGGATFTDGSFGFYNLSEPNVLYAQLDISPAPIPLPAGLPLLAAGLGGLALLRRRQKA
ncbi:MAG: VPLPA-CTERM sorting domain-containing protein [Pseudomonadota bacterium]